MNKKEILLARHFATLAMVYAVIAMALGVFIGSLPNSAALRAEPLCLSCIPTILHWEWCFFLS